MKNTWPNEVRIIFMAAAGDFVIDHQQSEKLRSHINSLWLAGTPEETISHEISILAAAMEGKFCAN